MGRVRVVSVEKCLVPVLPVDAVQETTWCLWLGVREDVALKMRIVQRIPQVGIPKIGVIPLLCCFPHLMPQMTGDGT